MFYSQASDVQSYLTRHAHNLEPAMRRTINMPAISACAQCHVSCAGGCAPIRTIYTASRRVNFTSASEWIGSEVTSILNNRHRLKHSCSGLCKSQGTCEIDTTPQSIESTFTGRHESFQYTKVRSIRFTRRSFDLTNH